MVLAVADAGRNLYVGGDFTDGMRRSLRQTNRPLGRRSFFPLGTGLNNWVEAIAVAGPDTYAVGGFVNAGGNAQCGLCGAVGDGLPVPLPAAGGTGLLNSPRMAVQVVEKSSHAIVERLQKLDPGRPGGTGALSHLTSEFTACLGKLELLGLIGDYRQGLVPLRGMMGAGRIGRLQARCNWGMGCSPAPAQALQAADLVE